MSDEELKAFSLQPLTLNIPSNTVLTECSIRDMDNLSLAITSQEKQDIMIIALEESCKNKIKKKEFFPILHSIFFFYRSFMDNMFK